MLVIVTKWNCYEPYAWEAEPFAAIALEEGWGRKYWYNSVQAIHSRCFGKPVAGQTCFGFGLKFSFSCVYAMQGWPANVIHQLPKHLFNNAESMACLVLYLLHTDVPLKTLEFSEKSS